MRSQKLPLHFVPIQKTSDNLKASGMEDMFEKLPLQLTVKPQRLGKQYRWFYLLSAYKGFTAARVSFFYGTFK